MPRSPWLAYALIVSLGLLVYAPLLDAYFVSDDFALIGAVAHSGFFATWGEAHGGFLRPVTILSYVADHGVWQLKPFGFHLTNILLHALDACLLLALMRRLLPLLGVAAADPPAFLTALLFLVLPCHSESVSWIAGRTDVIATAFGLGATLCFVRLIERSSTLASIGFAALFTAALLSKESAIVLPGVWALILGGHSFASEGQLQRRHLATLSVSLVLLVAYFAARKAILGVFIGGYGTERHIDLLNAEVLSRGAIYAVRSFLPPLPDASVFAVAVWVGLGITIGLALWQRRRLRPAVPMFFASCFAFSLVPALTMPVSLHRIEDERFLYLPSAFAAAAVVLTATMLLPSRRVLVAVVVVICALEVAALRGVNSRWVAASDLAFALSREIAELDPSRSVILNLPDNYRGAYVFRNGETAAATVFLGRESTAPYRVLVRHDVHSLSERFEVSIDAAGAHLRLPPGTKSRITPDGAFDVWRRRGEVLIRDAVDGLPAALSVESYVQGQKRPRLQRVGQIATRTIAFDTALALVRERASGGNWRGTIEAYEQAGGPSVVPLMLSKLAVRSWYELGEPARGRELMAALARRSPGSAAHPAWLGDLARNLRDWSPASHYYREALRLQPDDHRVANNLAWVLATADDPAVRDPVEAVRLAEVALGGIDAPDPNYLDTLALAYAAAGRFHEARETATRAARMAREQGNEPLSRQISSHIELFEADRAPVEPGVAATSSP